jgi:hypothetical protein
MSLHGHGETDIVGSQTALQRLTRCVTRILKSFKCLLGRIHGEQGFSAVLLRRTLHSRVHTVLSRGGQLPVAPAMLARETNQSLDPRSIM